MTVEAKQLYTNTQAPTHSHTNNKFRHTHTQTDKIKLGNNRAN